MHHELDVVTTPAGDPVAMVHCNNGASELAAWVGLFRRFAEAAGTPLDADAVYEALFREALEGEADAGGLLAYNHLAGEPIAGLDRGPPARSCAPPDSRFTLANFMRAQLYGVFGTLSLGMRVLAEEGVALDRMFAHGGMFRTAGVAQRFLAGALDAPVSVAETASEGGAVGHRRARRRTCASGAELDLGDYLRDRVFARRASSTRAEPDPDDVAGFAAYLDRYRAGLAIEARRRRQSTLTRRTPLTDPKGHAHDPQHRSPRRSTRTRSGSSPAARTSTARRPSRQVAEQSQAVARRARRVCRSRSSGSPCSRTPTHPPHRPRGERRRRRRSA